MRLLLALTLPLAFCSKAPPEAQRLVGTWKQDRLSWSAEFKSDERYVLHGDTGNTEGTWKLDKADGDTLFIETEVDRAWDHVRITFKDEDTLGWMNTTTGDSGIYHRQ